MLEGDSETEPWYKNCSSDALAFAQWGSSAITLHPPYTSAEYFPVGTTVQGTDETLSVITWGVPGIDRNGMAPEYYYYAQYVFTERTG